MYGSILCFELIGLYFLSRIVTQKLFILFLQLFRARSVAISLLLVLQFPGTVIHELSHLFTAEILGVKTGKLRLEPESIRGDDITPGSVMIAESDPFRRYAIGLAPLFWGISVLMGIAYFLGDRGNLGNWGYMGIGYLIFAVSNTMFPSPADIKGFWPFAIVVTLFVLGGYFIGFRFALTGESLGAINAVFTTLTTNLGIVIGVNIVLYLATSLASHFIMRLTKTRIVR